LPLAYLVGGFLFGGSMNDKANFEMRAAEKNLWLAFQSLKELDFRLAASQADFEESHSLSEMRHLPCHQRFSTELRTAYREINKVVGRLEATFEQPVIQRIIQSVKS
jgi:hypothetical protein